MNTPNEIVFTQTKVQAQSNHQDIEYTLMREELFHHFMVATPQNSQA